MDNDIRKASEDSYELIATCHFGLEAVLKKRLSDLDMRLFPLRTDALLFVVMRL